MVAESAQSRMRQIQMDEQQHHAVILLRQQQIENMLQQGQSLYGQPHGGGMQHQYGDNRDPRYLPVDDATVHYESSHYVPHHTTPVTTIQEVVTEYNHASNDVAHYRRPSDTTYQAAAYSHHLKRVNEPFHHDLLGGTHHQGMTDNISVSVPEGFVNKDIRNQFVHVPRAVGLEYSSPLELLERAARQQELENVVQQDPASEFTSHYKRSDDLLRQHQLTGQGTGEFMADLGKPEEQSSVPAVDMLARLAGREQKPPTDLSQHLLRRTPHDKPDDDPSGINSQSECGAVDIPQDCATEPDAGDGNHHSTVQVTVTSILDNDLVDAIYQPADSGKVMQETSDVPNTASVPSTEQTVVTGVVQEGTGGSYQKDIVLDASCIADRSGEVSSAGIYEKENEDMQCSSASEDEEEEETNEFGTLVYETAEKDDSPEQEPLENDDEKETEPGIAMNLRPRRRGRPPGRGGKKLAPSRCSKRPSGRKKTKTKEELRQKQTKRKITSCMKKALGSNYNQWKELRGALAMTDEQLSGFLLERCATTLDATKKCRLPKKFHRTKGGRYRVMDPPQNGPEVSSDEVKAVVSELMRDYGLTEGNEEVSEAVAKETSRKVKEEYVGDSEADNLWTESNNESDWEYKPRQEESSTSTSRRKSSRRKTQGGTAKDDTEEAKSNFRPRRASMLKAGGRLQKIFKRMGVEDYGIEDEEDEMEIVTVQANVEPKKPRKKQDTNMVDIVPLPKKRRILKVKKEPRVKEPGPSKERLKLKIPDKKFACSLCPVVVKTEPSIILHKFDHDVSEALLPCDRCGMQFDLKREKHEHVMKEHNKLLCFLCEQLYSGKSGFYHHYRIHHTEKILCELCGNYFRTQEMYKSHLQAHHGNERFFCPHDGCDRVFLAEQYLNTHMKTYHSEKRQTHTCEICGKVFVGRKMKLTRHLALHQNNRDHECPYSGCCKKFKRKNALKVHMLVHTDTKPVWCQYCTFRCRQRNSMHWHMKSKHQHQYHEYQLTHMSKLKPLEPTVPEPRLAQSLPLPPPQEQNLVPMHDPKRLLHDRVLQELSLVEPKRVVQDMVMHEPKHTLQDLVETQEVKQRTLQDLTTMHEPKRMLPPELHLHAHPPTGPQTGALRTPLTADTA